MVLDPANCFGRIDDVVLGAIVDTVLLAARVDGEFGDEERAELAAQLGRVVEATPLKAAVEGDALRTLLAAAAERMTTDGRDSIVMDVKKRLGGADACKGAFALAVRVMAADGVIRTTERELLLDLAEGLEIDRDDAADLVRDLSRPTQR